MCFSNDSFAGEGQFPITDTTAKDALIKLCKDLEKLPRHRVKDGQTFYYIDYDNVDALIEQARKSIGEPHVFSNDYQNKIAHG